MNSSVSDVGRNCNYSCLMLVRYMWYWNIKSIKQWLGNKIALNIVQITQVDAETNKKGSVQFILAVAGKTQLVTIS